MNTFGSYDQVNQHLFQILNIPFNFDMLTRELVIGNKRCMCYFLNGFIKDEVVEKMFEFLLKVKEEELNQIQTIEQFQAHFISFTESDINGDLQQLVTMVLSGMLVMIIEGFHQAIVLDVRQYPARPVNEPEDDRVLRGSHEGFKEILVENIVMIRRRIRDPKLSVEYLSIGSRSKTDIVMIYLPNQENEENYQILKQKLQAITIPSLTLAQQSLSECLLRKSWYHPMPRIRYTERPDSASASILEGKILVVVDNTPAVMIFPTSLFDFQQETNDYYFPPLIGTYLRWVRILVFSLSLLLIPIWYLVIQNVDIAPEFLQFMQIEQTNSLDIFFQLLIAEFIIDTIKLASLNTPVALSGSFSMIGALVLGEFAVKAHIFVPEVLLYMAFVAIANFTQPNYELGYSVKFFRIFLLFSICFFNIPGFIIGFIIILIIIASTPTVLPQSYLYPVFPFNKKRFMELFFRVPISRHNS
ncbi:MAG: spore germination protein [Erysipelotrichaceae bacterium]|nr:spore germination protein [Erysipelotrichaceae bacterium]